MNRRTPPTAAAVLAVIIVALLALSGCGSSEPSTTAAPVGPSTAPTAIPSAIPSATATPTAAPTKDEGPQPLPQSTAPTVTSLTIDSIGVRTKGLEKLALMKDAELSAPVDPDKAGWYAAGVVPGEVGPAVIAGHVDSKTGPAVFFELGDLEKGATVTVGLSDGTSAHFTVDKVLHTRKNAFPTDQVYGPTPDAQLRLITCSGPYDKSSVGYLDNTVVFATAVS